MPDERERIDLSTDKRYTITMKTCAEGFPYLDTFHYGVQHSSSRGNTVTLSNDPSGMDKIYASCSGGYDDLRSSDGDDDEYDSHCCECGEGLSVDDLYSSEAGDSYCNSCYGRIFITCGHCSTELVRRDHDYVTLGDGQVYCQSCADRYAVCCELCEEYVLDEETHDVQDAEDNKITVCDDCYDDKTSDCEDCGERFTAKALDRDGLCTTCRERVGSEAEAAIETAAKAEVENELEAVVAI
jgi:hypothetical protein